MQLLWSGYRWELKRSWNLNYHLASFYHPIVLAIMIMRVWIADEGISVRCNKVFCFFGTRNNSLYIVWRPFACPASSNSAVSLLVFPHDPDVHECLVCVPVGWALFVEMFHLLPSSEQWFVYLVAVLIRLGTEISFPSKFSQPVKPFCDQLHYFNYWSPPHDSFP